NPVGNGYLCPAFDPATSHCRIYDGRPLDCQVYPLAVMWNADRSQVVLGWDSKCPFMKNSLPPDIKTSADRVTALLERDDTIRTFARNPGLIGPFQEDVAILWPLPRLTERLRVGHEAREPVNREPLTVNRFTNSDSHLTSSRLSPPALGPLTLDDRSRFEQALASIETPLATHAFAPHFIWRALFSYWWTEIDGHLCLFAEHADGIFMPLPPLGPGERPPASSSRFEVRGSGPDSSLEPHASRLTPHVFASCFALMRERNKGSAVTRIENVSEELKSALAALGYRVAPKDSDYLYRTRALVNLAGDRYKSQRAACSRFVRDSRYRYEPYQDLHREACLALYRTWAAQQEDRNLDAIGRQMLKDSESAHREALTHHRALGLVGRVVWVDDAIRAYTFGYERSPSVFCVLLEVADRHIPGLAQFIFREFCREAGGRGYEFINTMDDSGLPSLARSKKAYHPVRLVPNYIATQPEPGWNHGL
ncbi:MAG: phosphatidylglycerol lysyltransferase domain-containing protein, partial [Nitrospirota bacterium]